MADTAPNPSAPMVGTPDTRDRILDAAEALFAAQGLAGTAVRDIAREVGLTPASLYNHFAGKQAIYDAVLERGVTPLLNLMRELPSRDHTGSRPPSMDTLWVAPSSGYDWTNTSRRDDSSATYAIHFASGDTRGNPRLRSVPKISCGVLLPST